MWNGSFFSWIVISIAAVNRDFPKCSLLFSVKREMLMLYFSWIVKGLFHFPWRVIYIPSPPLPPTLPPSFISWGNMAPISCVQVIVTLCVISLKFQTSLEEVRIFQSNELRQYSVMDIVIVHFTNVLALFFLVLNFAKTSIGKIRFLFPDIT